MNKLAVLFVLLAATSSCSQRDLLRENFQNPPNEFRPMPFWHLNGHLTGAGINKQVTEAGKLSGFGGIAVLPVTGMKPAYLSAEYFDRYADMLAASEERGMQIVLYDDIDFPSGSAGGRLQREYPEYARKYLIKDELTVKGGRHISQPCPADSNKVRAAVSAMNTATGLVVDLDPYIREGKLEWDVPQGEWRIMFFSILYRVGPPHGHLVDYMQPEAVEKLIAMTYDEYGKRFSRYFGNVITKTFFDDVGFVHQEHTWTPAITDIFRQKYGKNPALYYPALYYDIGPETQAARAAFYDIRSELMAEGYVRQVSEWSARHNLKSMGHPPENYSPNTVVANGDILKYYRHVHIPLLDAIFFYGRGLHGFKQVSSAADLGDRPLVGAELCGAFPANMDSLTLFRVVMEAMARGVNFVVPHGMWYDTEPAHIHIPPLISHESALLGPCLPRYSAYTGRSCMMLQGGARVSDIALLWPIAAIQGESYINRDHASDLPTANWLPANVNHHRLSDLLTNRLRRDFTFVHPEDLCNGKITVDGTELRLNNTANIQHYKVLIMPGGDVISASALKAVKQYYDAGGKVIATSSLPFKSAEFGMDQTVCDLVAEMSGIDPAGAVPANVFRENPAGGQFAFTQTAAEDDLNGLFRRMAISPDVCFDEKALPAGKTGYLNYIHKRKDGKDIYFLTNSTENSVSAVIDLRGRLKKLEYWNPHTGKIEKTASEFIKHGNEACTRVKIDLPAVSSIFIVGN